MCELETVPPHATPPEAASLAVPEATPPAVPVTTAEPRYEAAPPEPQEVVSAPSAKREAGQEVLNVGIDLGTSRSAVSASNGQRHLVESYVGWPVDMVARKVLKKSVLVGTAAVENRTMLDLHRPLERGLIKEGSEKDLLAVRELLGHLLRLAGATRSDGVQVRAVVGVPAEAMRVNKQQLRTSLAGVVDGLMIVSEPFAVAYGLGALLHSMVIDIGAGTTDFCIMRGRFPTDEDQRTLTKAGDSIDEMLVKLISERYPSAQFTVYMVRSWKESYGFVGAPQQKVEVTVPIDGRPARIDITDPMRIACESIIEPISESILDLLPRIDPEFQEKVRSNIILSGGSSLISGLRAELQKSMRAMGGGKIHNVKDPVYDGADGCREIAKDAAESDWEKLSH
jgi:rod shape-determining protein MreB